MLLINCEINLVLTWFAHCFIKDDSVNNWVLKFTLTDTYFNCNLMQNYYSKRYQVNKEQLTGINIDQQ